MSQRELWWHFGYLRKPENKVELWKLEAIYNRMLSYYDQM